MSRVFNRSAGNYLSSTIGTSAPVTTLSVAAWVKVIGSVAATRAFWSMDNGGPVPRLTTWFDSPDNDIFGLASGGPTVVANGDVVESTWQHVVYTLTATTSELYVGGVLQGTNSGAYDALATSISQFVLGSLPFGSDYFGGKLSRVSAWARVLSGSEITALAGGGLPSAAGSTSRWFDYDPDTLTNQFTPAAGLTAGALSVSGTVPVDSGDQPPIGGPPPETFDVVTSCFPIGYYE